MRRIYDQTLVLAIVAAALPFELVAAQNDPQMGPTLEVHIRTLKHDGGVGNTANGGDMFVPGRPIHWFVTAGRPYQGDLTVCGDGVSDMGTLGDKLPSAAFVWDIKMQPVKYENASATFALEWARYQADGGGRPAVEGKTTMTLRQGDSQPIDFVRSAPNAETCRDDAVVVEVGTGYKDARPGTEGTLQYDLWLKQQRANGEASTRRFTAMGVEGSDVHFGFAPVSTPVSQLGAEQPAVAVFTSVQGTIKGRTLSDGRITVIVDAARRDGVATGGAGPSGTVGASGRKVLEVSPGEAIEIELPPPGGKSSAAIGTPGQTGPRPESNVGQAVSVTNGRIVIDNPLFFQGQRTSLILQVKRVQQ
jgi:hypothetical protein